MIRKSVLLVAVVGVVFLSGCLDGGLPKADEFVVAEEAYTFDGTYTWRNPVRTDSNGSVIAADLSQDPDAPFAAVQLAPGYGAEPGVGVTKAGNIFTIANDVAYRTADYGRTWTPVHTLLSPNYPTSVDRFSTADPHVWVDRDTDRIFVNHMHPALNCAYIATSDDEGESWSDDTPVGRPGFMTCGAPIIDHQKLLTAPYGRDSPLLPESARGYPNVVYLCYNKVVNSNPAGSYCAVSLNGGESFAYDNLAIPPTTENGQVAPQGACPTINGHPAAHRDGTVVLPQGNLGMPCARAPAVAVTTDNGLTWEMRRYAAPDPSVDIKSAETDPDITITPDGTAYYVTNGFLRTGTPEQPDYTWGTYLFRSSDFFQTWEGPFRVSPAEHTLQAFVGITSGDDGRVAISYLGTRQVQEDDSPEPSEAIEGTRWHLFVSVSYDADQTSPTFYTHQADPEEDPVQVGCIWMRGGAGGPRGCRNLLDFIDMTVDYTGRYVVGFTDGCTPRHGCTGDPDGSNGDSHDRQVSLAFLDRGRSLFDAQGVLPSLGLETIQPIKHTAET